MKGFGIYVKNDLLEPKHIENMGEAVWLYLWLLDKMTSVNENGVGKVLGNQPVTYQLIHDELGLTERTYSRWTGKLRGAGYIQTLRTPYGLVFTVNKAEKIFSRKRYAKNGAPKKLERDTPEVAQQSRDTPNLSRDTPNSPVVPPHLADAIKTIQDNTIDNTSITNVIADPAKKPDRRKPEINNLFDFWAQTCSYNIESRVKANRYAASSLLKKYGQDKLEQLIRGVDMAHSDQYAPQIADFVELQQKVTRLVAWGKKKHGASTGGLKI